MAVINVDDIYTLDNTGKQVDDAVDYALANSNRNLLDNPWWGSGEVVNQRQITAKPSNGKYGIDRWIFSSGADVNSQDKYGRTALMSASMNCHTKIVQELLAKGADVSIKDSEGDTALDDAELNDNTEIINLLKSAGAKE